jgi:hypothetical protein
MEVKGMQSLDPDTGLPPEDSDKEISNEDKENEERRPSFG